MIVYLIVTAVAVFLGYLADFSKRACALSSGRTGIGNSRGEALSKTAVFMLLAVLFIPAALRQATGNDYMRYVEIFHLADAGARVPTEEGFNLFVRAVYDLCGYENYLLVFALFSLSTTALFLSAIRRQARFFGFSFYLFMMFGYYFQSYNTVRLRPESYNTVCPRPESCDTPRALMSVTPNLCCDETKNRGTYTHMTICFFSTVIF